MDKNGVTTINSSCLSFQGPRHLYWAGQILEISGKYKIGQNPGSNLSMIFDPWSLSDKLGSWWGLIIVKFSLLFTEDNLSVILSKRE